MSSRNRRAIVVGVATALLVAGCTSEETVPTAGPTVRTTTRATRPTTPPIRKPPVQDKPTGWGPMRSEVAEAAGAADELSVRELAGQVIVATYSGTQAPVDLVRAAHLGGVILMPENIASVKQVRKATSDLEGAVDRGYPLWVGVDQEGGIVQRMGEPMTQFPTYMSLGAADDPALATRAAWASGAELLGAGFDSVFSPDADVTSGPDDPTIGSRSAGDDPKLVTETMLASVRGYLRAGLIPVIKHFPGHGSVPADSHLTLPVQDASLAALRKRDLVPFERAISAGVSTIMVAHIDLRAVDPGVPSSLSRPVVTGLLRHDMGFHGVVISDALNMRAVVDQYGAGEAAVRALQAGTDVLLMPADTDSAIDAIERAVADGRLSEARLRQAATRMIAVLMHQEGVRDQASGPGTHSASSRAVSRQAVTIVAGSCRVPMIDDAARPVGDAEAVAAFRKAAVSAGVDTARGPTVRLIGYGGEPGSGDIVVGTDTPYVLASSRASTGKIALFGATDQAMAALVDVLTGHRQATGHLPVRVAGLSPGC